MCGIIGYIGEKQADQILLTGLQRLEYRGYDSAGIGVIAPDHSGIETRKAIGRVAKLEGTRIKGTIGIGHTRWATHGKPTLENAHPHLDATGAVAIVHNGIIENFLELKHSMRGHTFTSTTDSEVIAHIIEEWLKNGKEPLISAVQNSLKRLYGTYGLCVIHKDKDEIVGARNGSPLVIGIGEGENFVASDVSALVEHTKKVIYLDDFETAVVKKESVTVFGRNGKKVEKKTVTVNWDVALAEKHGFKHLMLQSIQ